MVGAAGSDRFSGGSGFVSPVTNPALSGSAYIRRTIYEDSLKNVLFFEIRYSPPFLCCLIDSTALKSMYELYIHSISLAIHRGRSVSGGAGFEVAVRQRGAPADGIDNRLRNRKNHEKSRFFDPKSIFSNFFQISLPTCPGHPPASPGAESCPEASGMPLQ